ncbi:MAG: acetolactate decarboxylase [Ilumatobacteraceae bacterium]|nr:acetolactate decarboxylase [Ilumatobacteraceae bacterium]
MTRDLIDDRLIGALHLRAMDRSAFANDSELSHTAFQVGTLNALMDGHFGGDATVGELLAHGDLGIGTIQHLDGEMIIVDGVAHVVDGSGNVHSVTNDVRTPFAVVCRFDPVAHTELSGPHDLAALHQHLDDLAPRHLSVLAIRVTGEFSDLRLRSVHGQRHPYPSLTEVTKHQTEWAVNSATGTVVGFRFPDAVAGVDVPGHHYHFISDDRTVGGHVLDITLLDGVAQVDGGDDLHVELPADVSLGDPSLADRAAIKAAEGG